MHSDWQRDKKIQKESQTACRYAHNNYIRDMISQPGSKNNKLYSNVTDMKCDSSGVATLKKDEVNFSEASDKIEILNEQFLSALTRQDCSDMPSMGISLPTEAPPLRIWSNRILLKHIKEK